MNFKIQLAAMFVFFVFDKNGLIKSCSSFEDYQYTKFHCPTLTGASFASTLNLNVRHFGMVEDTGLKSTASRSPSMAHSGHTDRQTDW
jgi:hypothetical protein